MTKGPVDGRDGWLGGGTGGGHHGCFQVHRLSISSVEINSSRYLQQNFINISTFLSGIYIAEVILEGQVLTKFF